MLDRAAVWICPFDHLSNSSCHGVKICQSLHLMASIKIHLEWRSGDESADWFRLVNWGTGLLCRPSVCLSGSVVPPSGWDGENEMGTLTHHKPLPASFFENNHNLCFWWCCSVYCDTKECSMLSLPLSLPLAYWRGLLLSMLLKLWLRRLRFDEPGLLEAPLPAAGTLEGPGNLWGRCKREGLDIKITYWNFVSQRKEFLRQSSSMGRNRPVSVIKTLQYDEDRKTVTLCPFFVSFNLFLSLEQLCLTLGF